MGYPQRQSAVDAKRGYALAALLTSMTLSQLKDANPENIAFSYSLSQAEVERALRLELARRR